MTGNESDLEPVIAIDHPERQNTPPSKDAFVWINQLSLVPAELLPPGPRETSSAMVDHWGSSENEAANRSGGADAIFRPGSRLLKSSFRPVVGKKPLRIHFPLANARFCGSRHGRLVHCGGFICSPNGGVAFR
jgi:hypothetical protein